MVIMRADAPEFLPLSISGQAASSVGHLDKPLDIALEKGEPELSTPMGALTKAMGNWKGLEVEHTSSPLIASFTAEGETPLRQGPEDFEILRVVGQGAFGKVFQVRQKATGAIRAMKVMRKDQVLARNHSEYMRQERDILTHIQHPFIIKMHYSFQTSSKLYLILDFVNGGHLFFQLYRQGMFSEDLARIYTAEIVLAVAHLHKVGIAHRDLKPENVLLDNKGHVVITDFGVAKKVSGDAHTNSLCGTMEYMAPEVVTAKGHGRPADWWSVGVLLYEMLTGKHPFSSRNKATLQKKILTEKLKLPSYLTQEAASLLKGLLNRDVQTRLGAGVDGPEKVKKHPFFKMINWKRLEAKEVKPPFSPCVEGELCVANFDEDFTSLPLTNDSPCSSPKLEAGSQAHDHFAGFTFVAPSFLEHLDKSAPLPCSKETAADFSAPVDRGDPNPLIVVKGFSPLSVPVV
mmetsp:Transcript_25783/g.48911  ORF Transcript_25783/g.48911 Transcript_25783/m.48911 type:complete len:460 (-) Transcript_25783:272-1651(-)|eukprot:CAMPEP_0114250874 /NCGR_PEP_ID=MMETSP0058-20121206/14942_1 /TAXON_ID=36894 /ORGANISM="Pyramimonas parkeae, CCMP726" /LENGTH=459 /DNA_ID=CAMNT_0001364583 /DNA_START=284 /DNA_END=1663 /DNA_ORIENTATION=+